MVVKLGGPLRLGSSGVVFNDGTAQTTAATGGGGGATRVVTGATGTNSTTDTALIMDAVAAVHAAGGGFVDLVGEDTYLVKPTSAGTFFPALALFEYNDVTIRGNGAVIKLDPTCETGTIALRLWGNRLQVHGVLFDLNSVAQATGITTTTGTGQRVRGCRSIGGGTAFLRILNNTVDLRVTSCKSFGQTYGILADNATGCSRIIESDNEWDGNNVVGDGVEFNQPTALMTDVHSLFSTAMNFTNAGNNGMGFGYAGVERWSNAHCTAINCSLDGLHIEDGARDFDVSDFLAYQCDRSGIAVQSGTFANEVCYDGRIHHSRVIECGLVSGTGAVEAGGSLGPHQRVHFEAISVRDSGRAGAATYYGFELGLIDSSVKGCEAWNTRGTATAGFKLLDANDVLFQANTASDNQGTKTQDYGLRIQGTVTNLRLLANDLSGNGTDALDISAIGAITGVYTKVGNVPDSINDDILAGSGSNGWQVRASDAGTFGTSATATQNAAAINAAVQQAEASSAKQEVILDAGGTIDIDAEIPISELFTGKWIHGVGMRGTRIRQTTQNAAIFSFYRDNTQSIRVTDFDLTWLTQPLAAHTNAYALAFSSHVSSGQGHLGYELDRLWIDYPNVGIGIREGAGEHCPWWGMKVGIIYIRDPARNGLRIASPNTIGQPENAFAMMYIQRFDATRARAARDLGAEGAAVYSGGAENVFQVLGIEDGEGYGLYLIGDEATHCDQLHVERHHFTQANDTFCYLGHAALTVNNLRIMATVNVGAGNDSYWFKPDATSDSNFLYVNRYQYHFAHTSGNPTSHVYQGGTRGMHFGQVVPISGSAVPQIHPTWDTDAPARLLHWNGKHLGGYTDLGDVANGATMDLTREACYIAPSGARTGLIMPLGKLEHEPAVIVNRGSAIGTFAADATSHVAGGTSIIVPVGRARHFRWRSAAQRWYADSQASVNN